ncbi:MAG TPA: GNVR domain-containing protein [Acidobacteriaceae bacterium]|nr:GNVR domain-containing protein [Acidobacteriaceae bacterium]
MKPNPLPPDAIANAAPVWDESPAPPIDLLPVAQSVIRRWPFLLGSLVCGFVLAYAASFLVKPRFEATAVFLPPTQHNALLDNPLAALWTPAKSDLYPGLLASNSVVDDVIDQLDLEKVFRAKDREDARTILRRNTAVSSDIAGFYTIGVFDTDAGRAKAIADAYLNALARVDTRLAVDQAMQQSAVYEQQLQHEKSGLDKAEVDLKQAQEAQGIVSPQSQTQSGLSAIEQLRAQINNDEVSLSALRQGETENAPDVVRLRSQIATLTAQKQRMENGAGGGAGAGISAAQAPQVNLDFARLQREVQFHQAMFELLTRQFESARLQQTASAPGVQVVDYPETPLRKATPRRRMYALAGACLGFFLALVAVFIGDRYRVLRADPERSSMLRTLHQSATEPTWRP